MFYYLYKITNKINGKIYVGVHRTDDLNDEYFGSGKILKRAIKKYSLASFEKEILEVFDSEDAMYAAEAKLVTAEFVKSDDTYNLREGGSGGFDHINVPGDWKGYGNLKDPEVRKKTTVSQKERYENDPMLYERIKKISKNNLSHCLNKTPFLGKHHTDETKKKIGMANSKQRGKLNSQYGTCWVYNNILQSNIKIKKEELEKFLSKGWTRGRKNYLDMG